MNDIETEKIFIYLRASINKIQKAFFTELKTRGISNSHLVYLMLLRRSELGLTMTELSKLSYTDKALTTRSIRELEEKNHVYRENNDKILRKYKIFLTPKGKKETDYIQSMMERNRAKFLEKFTKEEKTKVFEAIDIIITKIKSSERRI